jgi:hypothetical protein
MPGVIATPLWQTMGEALADAESWQAQDAVVHVTADTPASTTDNEVFYHILSDRESMTFPADATISYRCIYAAQARISRQPVA